jgi:hypothetical protein
VTHIQSQYFVALRGSLTDEKVSDIETIINIKKIPSVMKRKKNAFIDGLNKRLFYAKSRL